MLADPWYDLAAPVVSAVKAPPVDKIAAWLQKSFESRASRWDWTVQKLSNLFERVLQIEVHLVNFLDSSRRHSFASYEGPQLGPTFNRGWLGGDKVLLQRLNLFVGWTSEEVLFLPLFFLQYFRACFNHVTFGWADVIIILELITFFWVSTDVEDRYWTQTKRAQSQCKTVRLRMDLTDNLFRELLMGCDCSLTFIRLTSTFW